MADEAEARGRRLHEAQAARPLGGRRRLEHPLFPHPSALRSSTGPLCPGGLGRPVEASSSCLSFCVSWPMSSRQAGVKEGAYHEKTGRHPPGVSVAVRATLWQARCPCCCHYQCPSERSQDARLMASRGPRAAPHPPGCVSTK